MILIQLDSRKDNRIRGNKKTTLWSNLEVKCGQVESTLVKVWLQLLPQSNGGKKSPISTPTSTCWSYKRFDNPPHPSHGILHHSTRLALLRRAWPTTAWGPSNNSGAEDQSRSQTCSVTCWTAQKSPQRYQHIPESSSPVLRSNSNQPLCPAFNQHLWSGIPLSLGFRKGTSPFPPSHLLTTSSTHGFGLKDVHEFGPQGGSRLKDYPIALLRLIEGGVLIGIKCNIRSRAFIWSPFDLIERIKIQILCLFNKQIFVSTWTKDEIKILPMFLENKSCKWLLLSVPPSIHLSLL